MFDLGHVHFSGLKSTPRPGLIKLASRGNKAVLNEIFPQYHQAFFSVNLKGVIQPENETKCEKGISDMVSFVLCPPFI